MGTLALPFTSVGVRPHHKSSWTASRIAHFEELKAQNEAEAEKFEEQVRNVQKKMQAMESQFDVCTEDLFNQTIKLEEMEKKAGNAEGEVSALRSRLILLQENNEKQEERLCKATLELAGACKRADAAVKKRIELENEVSSNEEAITWISSWKNQSSISLLQNQSLMTSPENWQQWSQMLPELQRELMLLRRKLQILRRSSELWDRICRPWRLGKRRLSRERRNIRL